MSGIFIVYGVAISRSAAFDEFKIKPLKIKNALSESHDKHIDFAGSISPRFDEVSIVILTSSR